MLLSDFSGRSHARSSKDADGTTFVVLDSDGSRRQRGRVLATLAALALFFFAASVVFDANYFVTTSMVTAYWMFILATLLGYRLLTPIGAVLGVRVTPHGVRLRSLLVRKVPRTDTAAGVRGCGPLPLGLGRPAPSTFLSFSEMEEVRRTDDTLFIRMHNGATHRLPLPLTEEVDIIRIEREIRTARKRADAAGFADRAESDAARARLEAVVPEKR